MKAANADRQTRIQERCSQINSAGKLIGLDANQRDQRFSTGFSQRPENASWPDASVGFIIGVQTYLNVRTEYLAGTRILGKTVQACQRVRRNS